MFIALIPLLVLIGCDRDSRQREAARMIQEAETKAAMIVDEARKRADAMIKNAAAEAEKARAADLLRVLAGAKQYLGDNQWVEVNQVYLDRFRVTQGQDGGKLRYVVRNGNSYGDVKPRFTVILYDENAVQSGIAKIFWLFDSVGPGKSREEEERFESGPSNKPPRYFRVEFK
jgi:hypothetical protein